MDLEFNCMISRLRTVFDKCDDYLSADLVATEDHRFINRVIELEAVYSNVNQSWYSLYLVKDDNPYAVAHTSCLMNWVQLVMGHIHAIINPLDNLLKEQYSDSLRKFSLTLIQPVLPKCLPRKLSKLIFTKYI